AARRTPNAERRWSVRERGASASQWGGVLPVVACRTSHRPACLELGFLLREGGTLVGLVAAPRDRELDLGPPVFEVEAQRNERQPLLVGARLEPEHLVAVHEQLAAAVGVVAEHTDAVRVRRDV